jgi:hypothetical protein
MDTHIPDRPTFGENERPGRAFRQLKLTNLQQRAIVVKINWFRVFGSNRLVGD